MRVPGNGERERRAPHRSRDDLAHVLRNEQCGLGGHHISVTYEVVGGGTTTVSGSAAGWTHGFDLFNIERVIHSHHDTAYDDCPREDPPCYNEVNLEPK